MKILIIGDRKTGKYEYIKYDEPGSVPPLVNPPNPGEPKDGGVPPLSKDPATGKMRAERVKKN